MNFFHIENRIWLCWIIVDPVTFHFIQPTIWPLSFMPYILFMNWFPLQTISFVRFFLNSSFLRTLLIYFYFDCSLSPDRPVPDPHKICDRLFNSNCMKLPYHPIHSNPVLDWLLRSPFLLLNVSPYLQTFAQSNTQFSNHAKSRSICRFLHHYTKFFYANYPSKTFAHLAV